MMLKQREVQFKGTMQAKAGETRSRRFGPLLALTFGLLGLALPGASAQAQSLVATVNGDPITNVDIAEREKLLRAIGLPSSADAAMESVVKEKIEAREAGKYGIKAGAGDVGPVLQSIADRVHMSPEALTARIQAAHIDSDHLKNYLSATESFMIYARALNRAVEASESEIRDEMAREKSQGKAQISYTIRQVIVTVSPSEGAAGLQAGAKTLEGLRARFTDCASGEKIAVAIPNVVVREPITRTSSQLGEPLKKLLDSTPVGHLTAPSRDATGIVSLALCEKSSDTNSQAVKDAVSQKIIARHIEQDADKLYKDLRKSAVIVKH
jgi:peptidyl-prolyl cis-trans isomerase SurA